MMVRITAFFLLVLTGLSSQASVVFTDNFDRADGTVGNGWVDFPDGSAPLSIVSGKLAATTSFGGSGGVYRPFSFTTPTTVSFVVTETDGIQLTGSRFESRVTVLNDGTIGGGYGIRILRSSAGINNSAVYLEDDGTVLGLLSSPFQFDSVLQVSVTIDPSGAVTGTVTEGTNVFNFSFPAPASIASSGNNLGYLQSLGNAALFGTTDDFVVDVDLGALFADDFERPDNPSVGNGWSEFSTRAGDWVSIFDNELRIAKNAPGTNSDGAAHRPFSDSCGVTARGIVEWPTSASTLGQAPAAMVVFDAAPPWKGLAGMLAQMRPAVGDIQILSDGVALNAGLFTFELDTRYNFEWKINADCSSEFRAWVVGGVKPTAAVVATSSVSPTFDGNNFSLQAAGGAGCCSYPPYDVRFEEIEITTTVLVSADAGVDQSVDEGELTILDGSASAGASNYEWSQIAGPTVTLDDSTGTSPSFVAPYVPANTTLTFQLLVDDGAGSVSDPDTVDVTIVDVNSPPVADAGDDGTIKEGAVASLDGNNSFDPEGDAPLSFQWAQTNGPSVVLTPSATSVSPTFVAPLGVGNQLTFELVVDDGKEQSAADVVHVTVVENTAPVADAGPDQTVDEGSLVALDGRGSADADGGDQLSFNWSEPLALDDDTSPMPTFTAPAVVPGGQDLVFDLVVTDDDPINPKSSVPDQVTISVRNINDPPSCDLARAVCSGSKIKNNGGCTLWPPNHKMIDVTIEGVSDTDASYSDLVLSIASVTQDEPTSGAGGGDSSPDAIIQSGVAIDSVLLRAERQGSGNGRVYTVSFVADDGFESCTGSVLVTVPPSRQGIAVDDGQAFDSTTP